MTSASSKVPSRPHIDTNRVSNFPRRCLAHCAVGTGQHTKRYLVPRLGAILLPFVCAACQTTAIDRSTWQFEDFNFVPRLTNCHYRGLPSGRTVYDILHIKIPPNTTARAIAMQCMQSLGSPGHWSTSIGTTLDGSITHREKGAAYIAACMQKAGVPVLATEVDIFVRTDCG